MVQDPGADTGLLERHLEEGGYDLVLQRVDSAEALRQALKQAWDLVISEYFLEHFSAHAALRILKESGNDLPFIVFTGSIAEETAVEIMREGAHDYVMKHNMTRLLPVIDRELREAGERSRRRQAEEALRASEKRFRSIFQNAVAGMAVLSLDGRFLQVNPALCQMLNYSESELLGLNALDITHPADLALTRRILHEGDKCQRQSADYEKRFIRRDGDTLWAHVSTTWLQDTDGRPTNAVVLITDITPHHQAKREIRQMAYFDNLTGLPNRQLFVDRCEKALNRARRNNSQVGVFIVDLDRFKGINETFSYAMGDYLLNTVSERLNACMRRGDHLARLGSDEFAVVSSGMESQEDFTILAQKILSALTTAFVLEGQAVYSSACIGIALFPMDGAEVEVLLKNAGAALNRAKEAGAGNYRYYSMEMNQMARERMAMEASLSRALEKGELRLYYQPQVDLASGAVVAMEALLRWDSPEFGSIPPTQFIPLAEQTGLIQPIGDWVLETAFSQAREWHRSGFGNLRMAVNISARQFKHADFVDRIDQVLQKSGIDPSLVELEVTESIVMERSEENLMTLTDLKSRGMKLAIDDFGTGYSMLSYLKYFPIDRLKIDRGFVSDISTDSDDAAITDAIIAMAHGLRVKVLAEGVETREQLDFLNQRCCQEGQGFFFSQPLTADQASDFLRNTNCRHRHTNHTV